MWLILVACRKPGTPAGQGRYTPDEYSEKWGREHPQEYKQLVSGDITSAQRTLAEFGYGVRFTGLMDEQTVRAVRQYQQRSGLPATGDLDPMTRQRLSRDRDAIRNPILPGSIYKFNVTGGLLLAEGVWLKRNANIDGPSFYPGSIVVAHVECRHYPSDAKCWDAENVLTGLHEDPAGTVISSALLNEAEITHWSGGHVEAEYRHPVGGLSVRYWFDLEKHTAIKAWIRDRGTEYWDLADGGTIHQKLLKKQEEARRRIMLLPEYTFLSDR